MDPLQSACISIIMGSASEAEGIYSVTKLPARKQTLCTWKIFCRSQNPPSKYIFPFTIEKLTSCCYVVMINHDKEEDGPLDGLCFL